METKAIILQLAKQALLEKVQPMFDATIEKSAKFAYESETGNKWPPVDANEKSERIRAASLVIQGFLRSAIG